MKSEDHEAKLRECPSWGRLTSLEFLPSTLNAPSWSTEAFECDSKLETHAFQEGRMERGSICWYPIRKWHG